ncbi:PREDICTED: protein ENHANCED DISEASE RESISTANCE 4-like isoform X2 [Ipomoea nil]|uniref:protein ENHANCED DISEASE RESISTANCE 4-like isoform X2 n=1 Tax=Ipomoea nil TaxID=35883 RepID=UPI000901848B|nr:PREDICTED: protein ENHANCED DISEASE RESISTANCE 4-like isoform X2 [Ipomoea nil]
MANVVKSQVRLVRCPKCRKVLEEPTESIVYKCGGCDTVLQAKKRKNNTSTELSVLETHPRDSKEKGISSLHQKDSSISSVDTLQSESCKIRYEIGECSKVRSGQEKSPRLSSSFHEIDGKSSSAREPIEQHEDECPIDRNFSGELSESNELKHHGTEVSSAPREAGEQMECIRRCEYESEACEMESPEYTNSLAGSSPFSEEANADSGKSHSLSQESNDPNDFAGHTLEYIEHAKSSGEIISPESQEIQKPSPVQTEVDQSPLHEGIQQPEQSDKEIARSFDRISSVDTLDNLPLDPQPTVTHRDMPKSPTTRSYYAYDGSASSCDGDSKFSQQVGRKFESAKLKIPDEFRSDDECNEDSMLSRKPRTHHPAKNCSQMLPRRMHRANQDKWAESRRCDQTFRHHSSFYPSNMPTYADREKMELLRMVHDLENQLQETRLSKGKANRRFRAGDMRPDDMHAPLYSDQFQPDADPSHRRCPIRCSQGQGFSSKISRIPFSGEAVHYRHRGDCMCLHCSPQVWHCSSQLPLGSICCNKSHLAACTNHNYVNATHSSSSSQSPQHYTNSKYYSKWGHEPKSSSDQRQKDHEVRKLHLGERYGKMRHVLPFEGGAPIVACDHCSELLQLPADFGVIKRRSYQLVRCNACLKVLKFDLRNRTDISNDRLSENSDSVYDMGEQAAATLAPPPSESSDLNERNPAPQRCLHAESLSYSDDLGPSFCRSCSTEVEPSSVPHGRTTFNRKVSSASSMEDRKMKSVMRESRSKPVNSCWEHAESAAGPSNWGISSSEIEEVHEHPNAGSPLHRLMGYSTISQVLR